LYYSCYI